MRKILVIRLSSLGDVVLTFPVLAALRKAYPDAEIVSLVKEAFADAFAGNRDVSRVLTLTKGESVASLVGRVRAEHFDTVIDLHGNLRSRIVSFFSGAAKVVRYQKATMARRLYVQWRVPSAVLEHHTLERYFDAVRQLDPKRPEFRPIGSMPQSILVIQTAFLGDAVLTTPLLNTLRTQWPGAAITVLATPETQDVFARNAGVKDVILYDKRGKDKGFGALKRLVQALRARHFDLAILPHRSFKSALMAWAAGIPRRVGFSASQGRWLLTDVVPFEWGVHDVDRNLKLLGALGLSESAPVLQMSPDPAAADAVRERLVKAGIRPGDRLVGIHSGSVWPTKRWLPERFAAVADRLMRELGARVVFVGGPKDRAATEALMASLSQPALNWVGETSLKELVAVIARCDAFLTNDSGPMHIAVACGVPTTAIFGPTTKELGFFPYGPGHKVIERDLSCRPCGLHGGKECPLGHFNCMRSISVDDVFKVVAESLQKERLVRANP